jgi:anaerobic selenocysteine-containing dehydrogenase/Fe-S-cluster-containing dehydrogenase component
MANLSRRDFLKIAGLTGSAALAGCSEPTRRLIPYVIPPEDIIPGEATWYATTCRECPAGCGIHAKNRDGHVIKVEGNPHHPINHGRLCPRGQASVQGLYNPERFRGPLRRNASGFQDPVTWQEAETEFVRRLSEISRRRGKGRVVFLSELITGTEADLARRWVASLDGEVILYEPYSYEALREANQIVFGVDAIPFYHMERADLLISFNAPFLEAWLSNVEYTWQFANFHAVTDGRKNLFLWIGPRFSMTAASADEWIATPPGTEYLVALGLLKVLEEEGFAPIPNRDFIRSMTEPFPLDAISQTSGVDIRTLRTIARLFVRAERPLVLSAGLTTFDPNAVATGVASNLLCTVKPGTQDLINFDSASSYSTVVSSERMKRLVEQMAAGEIDALIFHGANPVFTLPKSWNFQSALQRVPFIVSLSTYRDETSRLAHLVLPTHHFLESWADHTPRKGITGIVQPTMGNFFNTRNLGDILISTGKQIDAGRFPWGGMYQSLKESWGKKSRSARPGSTAEAAWNEALKSGGEWGEPPSATPPAKAKAPFKPSYSFPRIEAAAGTSSSESVFSFVTYPTVQFLDGRMANRLWIQELPDPITMATWGGWVEMHHETAKQMGIKEGDLVRLQSSHGYVDGPALPFFTVPARTVAMPLGQGHTGFGGYSDGLPANPLDLFPPGIDPASGGIRGPSFRVTLSKLKGTFPVAHTDGYFYQRGRGIAQAVGLEEYREIIQKGIKPDIRMPLSEGFKKEVDFYPAHHHDQYRWAMAIDLDRCIGCGACVVACSAENNVPVVGRQEILHQREMAWLRVERYFDHGSKVRVHYIPVPCQHCDEAPCESVCPVFAPNHGIEGINNQVYNRCIGTRDCSQNCPYKVRRFNFFNWKNPEPLQWQYNPDVTVRQKGVMEKCSFCIQRVVQAKTIATSEGRAVKDGEFTTACAQTCPANAIIFGNLKDPNSRVAKLFQDPRAYQLLYDLNTKPGVVYLKKVVQGLVV